MNEKPKFSLHKLPLRTVQLAIISVFLLLGSLPLMAQSTMRVGGVVKSAADDFPLIGVNVVQKGTNNGVITDFDGRFSLNVPVGAELEFTYIGFLPQQLKVAAGRTEYNVIMTEDAQTLEEVVVVGYGTQKKSVVTAAIGRVSGGDLDLGTPTTVQGALKGKASGITIISNSGAPGGDSKVRVRGVGSVNDSDPLYVIDGMPSSNGINYLNPSDIESIEVLKDAASAAIYGARGANGVVLVTTKGGQSGKATFNYEFSYGFQNPTKKSDQLNGSEYQMIMNEMGKNSGRGDNFYFPTQSNVNTNWEDVLRYKDAPIVNHRFSASGGGDRSTYYVSFGIIDQSGIYAKNYADYRRYNARMNYTNTLLDTKDRSWLNKVTLGARVSYSHEKITGSNIGNSEAGGVLASMNMLPPTETVYQDDPDKLAEYARVYPNHVVDDNGRAYNIIDMREIVNPLASLKVRNNQLRTPQIFNGNFSLDFNLLPGLTFKTNADFEWKFNSDRRVTPAYELNTDQKNSASNVYNSQSQAHTWQWENLLRYNNSFGKHNLGVILGTTLLSSHNEYINGTRYDLNEIDMDKGYLDISGAPQGDSRAVLNGNAGDHKMVSVFGRLSYNYDEKYMAEFTIRRDGSSNFGRNNLYGVFPSVSAGWVFTQEKFMENRPSWFGFGKIRASWGQNGNENIGKFHYTSLVASGDRRAVINDIIMQGAKPTGYSNPNIKWETSEQTDIGIDLRFFGGLSITVDWFEKKTKDMLSYIPLPDYSGFKDIASNVGTVSNKGWEFDVSYRFKAGNVNMNIGANASHVKNVVTNLGDSDIPVSIDGLGGGLGGAVTWKANGEPFGYFYGYVHDGIFQNEAEVKASKQSDAQVGGIRWKDLDGVDGITGDDRTNIGNPIPDWTFGLNINAMWKEFDLSLFFQGTQGNDIYKLYRRTNVTKANWGNEWLGRWTGEGTSNWYPQIVEGGINGADKVSNLYVEDGSYFRLKVLQLGYTLPQNITRKALISKLRLFVQAENLFTITGYSGLDPEVGTRNGFDGGTYPQARTYSFGLNLTF